MIKFFEKLNKKYDKFKWIYLKRTFLLINNQEFSLSLFIIYTTIEIF